MTTERTYRNHIVTKTELTPIIKDRLHANVSDFGFRDIPFPSIEEPTELVLRTIATTSMIATVEGCLGLLGLNVTNRDDIRWNWVKETAEKMRTEPTNWEELFFPMVSMLSLSAVVDEVLERIVAFELGDGQHRLIAFVVAFGNHRQVQHMLYMLRRYQGFQDPYADHPDAMNVYPEDHVLPTPGDGSEPESVPFDDWYDFAIETYKTVTKDGEVRYKYRTDGFHGPATEKNDGFEPMPITGWTYAGELDEAGELIPTEPAIPVSFSLQIGVDHRVKNFADLDGNERTGADQLNMNPYTSKIIAHNGMVANVVDTFLTMLEKRFKPVKTNEEGETVRGSLKKGGKGLSPKSRPGQFVLHETELVKAKQLNTQADEQFADLEIDLGTSPLGPRIKEVGKPVTLQSTKAKKWTTGSKIPETYITLWTLGAILAKEGAKRTITDAEIVEEITSMRYGVRPTADGSLEACNHYDAVREYLKDCKLTKSSPHPDILLSSLIAFSQSEDASTLVEDAHEEEGRFPGLDMTGYSPKHYAIIRGKDPSRVGAGRGRPKGAKNKTKKAK